MKSPIQLASQDKGLHFRKTLSLPAMLKRVRGHFTTIRDSVITSAYSLTDVLMSGLAIFGLKYSSLLKFDEKRVLDGRGAQVTGPSTI
jgi:hypothetical protein